MKKVTIYFKSGNKLKFKCKDFTASQSNGVLRTEFSGSKFNLYMFDNSNIEHISVVECFNILKFIGL